MIKRSDPSPRGAESQRLEGLDVLRGLAAASVMIYHYTAWYSWDMGGHPPPGPALSLPYGNFGVDLFFMISGFVIMMTVERTATRSAFALSRFARLFPAFLACMAITALAGGALHGFDTFPGLVRAAGNLTMAPALFGQVAIDGSYWSLAYELGFYALAAAFLPWLRRRPPEPACAAWLLVSLGLRFADTGPFPVAQVLAAPYAPLFVMGIVLYRLHTGKASAGTWAVMLLAFQMTWFGPLESLMDLPPPGYACLIAAFAAAIHLLAKPWVRGPFLVPLRCLGRISYPLYLLHQDIGMTLIARLENQGVAPDIAILTVVSIMLLAAWTVSAGVEYPARRAIHAWYRAWRARPVPPAAASGGMRAAWPGLARPEQP
jgi:hypothetical protein